MTTVAITGVNGLVGRRLLQGLAGRSDVERVIGLDLHLPAELAAPGVDLRVADVRDPDVGDHFAGVDVVVHLAFALDPMRDETTMHEINVGGPINVLTAAARAGARKVVYLSSGVVYGGHPDNDFPLHESSPRRVNPDFNYAEHKGEIEDWLWGWAEGQDDLTVTVLRPGIISGPGVDNFITRQLEYPRFPVVRGHHPPWQFVHVDDVVSALELSIDQDLPGAFNVAADGWLSFGEVVAISGVRTVEIPEEVAFATAERLWRRGLGLAPAGQLHYVMHPWVMSVEKLRSHGWRPRHTNREVLAELRAMHADHLRIPGGPRVSRNAVRAVGISAGLATVGAAALLVRRRRTRA